MSAILYQGAVAPEAYVLTVTPGASGLDLSTVSAASFKVRKPDGSEVTWTVSLSAQTATTLTITRALASGTSDVDLAGTYKIYALLTIPGGFARTRPRELIVKSKYEAN